MSRNQTTNRAVSLPSKSTGWKHGAGARWLLLLLFVLLFYASLSPHLIPRTYDIKLGTISDREIVARKQWNDEKATIKAQERAAENVEPKYSIVALRNEGLIEQIFGRVEQLNAEDQVTFQNKVDIYRREIPERYVSFVNNFVRTNLNSDTYSATLLEEMAKNVKDQQYQIPEETYYKLPLLSSKQIEEMEAVGVDVVRKLMSEQLRDAETARAKVAELVNTSALNDRTSREIVAELARYAIMPNKFYDKEATEEARVQAKEDTQPVVIKEGDVVVKRGQLITEEVYERLEGLGLLQDSKNYWPHLGLLLLSLLFLLLIYFYLEQSGILSSGPDRKYNNAQLLMLWLIFALNLLTMSIISMIQTIELSYIGYLAPAALGAILIALLLDTHLAMVCSLLFATIGSIMFNLDNDHLFDFRYGFVIAVVSFAAIFAVHRASQRSTILKAGIMVSLFGTVSVLTLLMFGDALPRTELIYAGSFAFASGLLTAVLVIGLMPFFEISFGILSALKLVELSNPNHPLLRKLLTETPGTYHHSVMVGNLSEAAAEAIGANGLLCRVGSFYHDIGKTKRPSYFIENQTNIENPHDSIEPKLSKSIIIAHARDGVDMLKAHNIPKPIRDIAEQHHGTTCLKYFYHKAVKLAEAEGEEPDFTEDDFRYSGPKAQSKEAAIVGIADCVEAAVRSLRNPTMEQIETMIQKIIKNRLDDNQFNECDLTMKELDSISQTLKETVVGIFHSRIEYPEDVKPKERLG
ncbi:metal-dependent phosphohydrolase [Paenibacillus sambharensis]|uniref:Metal-dependent phosphohydrolase n=1 Tax=Paenibacillus sambharensis TaxID=1803190 RepID=A0A2W1L4U6_9BACL|nr:HDIG domain-containing metalloprotein [Paenibacillus sambharensis]PZD93933.1 metal-dependent phosphohydrolase [Paenibacillus sambharensis]